jgi:hypothetical protein
LSNITRNTDREQRLPDASELCSREFQVHGIQCKSCGLSVVQQGKVARTLRAPKLPWNELIECLTCVKPEDYKLSETADIAFQHFGERAVPSSGTVFVAEAHICVNGADAASQLDLQAYSLDVPPTLLSEPEENAISSLWSAVFCQNCKRWLGDGRRNKETNSIEEVRLFKYSIRTAHIFDNYRVESVLCGAALEATTSRECYRFVLSYRHNGTVTPCARLILLSYDSWMATEDSSKLKPIMKFLFFDYRNVPLERATLEVNEWTRKNGAEWLTLPSSQVCHEIVDALETSNKRFPHSIRHFPDGSSVGFLVW